MGVNFYKNKKQKLAFKKYLLSAFLVIFVLDLNAT